MRKQAPEKNPGGLDGSLSECLIRAEFSLCSGEKQHSEQSDHSNSDRPTVVIADDYKPIRDAIADIVRADFTVVGEAENGEVALKQCLALEPAIAILDIQMPVMSGFQVARELKRRLPAISIIFVTQQNTEWFREEAFKRGASACVVKSKLPDDLALALRAVSSPRGAGQS